jgi:hypothetical protein
LHCNIGTFTVNAMQNSKFIFPQRARKNVDNSLKNNELKKPGGEPFSPPFGGRLPKCNKKAPLKQRGLNGLQEKPTRTKRLPRTPPRRRRNTSGQKHQHGNTKPERQGALTPRTRTTTSPRARRLNA